MENESIKKTIGLINELEKLETLDNNQIMDYAQWAGRLSSLGDNLYLDRFFQRFDVSLVNTALKKRISEGLVDIKEAFGEYLAVEIFTVQDFCCFVNHAPEGAINSDVKEFLDYWVRTAELQNLDNEAALTLEDYLDSYPIAEEDQLDVIAAPLTAKAFAFWDAVLEPMDDIIEQNSEKLKNQIRIEKADGATDGNLVSIHIVGVKPEEIVKVYQRGVPAVRSKTDPSVWTFDFESFGTTLNENENIVVQTFGGAQASVPIAFAADDDSLIVGTDILGVTLFDRMYATMAAADDDQEEFKECVVEGVSAALDIAVNQSKDQVVVNVWKNWDCDNRSSELDGWAFYDRDNTLLGVIQNAHAEFKCSQFDGYLELKDPAGKAHKIDVNK